MAFLIKSRMNFYDESFRVMHIFSHSLWKKKIDGAHLVHEILEVKGEFFKGMNSKQLFLFQ